MSISKFVGKMRPAPNKTPESKTLSGFGSIKEMCGDVELIVTYSITVSKQLNGLNFIGKIEPMDPTFNLTSIQGKFLALELDGGLYHIDDVQINPDGSICFNSGKTMGFEPII
jgi:hypothetical protein